MAKKALLIGCLLGMLGVIIGAFGAHALKDSLIINGKMAAFETGVRYQFYHAIALIIAGMIGQKIRSSWITRASILYTAGTVVFSGSLYILSITNVGYWGMITPIGGILLILGWIALFLGIAREGNFD